MARPNGSSAFKTSQGKTVVLTPAQMEESGVTKKSVEELRMLDKNGNKFAQKKLDTLAAEAKKAKPKAKAADLKDDLAKRRQKKKEAENSTFAQRLKRGDLKGALDESIRAADEDLKKARRTKFNINRRKQESSDAAQKALDKYPLL